MKLSHSSLKFNNIRYNFRFLSANFSRLLAAEELVIKPRDHLAPNIPSLWEQRIGIHLWISQAQIFRTQSIKCRVSAHFDVT